MGTRSRGSDFEIVQTLGSGGMGKCVKARRKADNKFYAIKQIHVESLAEKDQLIAVNEVKLLAVVHHEHIVNYFDSFIEDGCLNIVMELAEGGTIGDKIQERVIFPEGAVWRFMIQTLLALEHLHNKRIIHRDIKPENLFLNSMGDIKLGDFGVAKLLTEKKAMARTVVGTPYYLSPEILRDMPYNDKSDVWALGCVLYEMCTHRPPFQAGNQGALILKILEGTYDQVRSSLYSKKLLDIIYECLTYDPARRPDVASLLGRATVRSKAQAMGLSHMSPSLFGEGGSIQPITSSKSVGRVSTRRMNTLSKSTIDAYATTHFGGTDRIGLTKGRKRKGAAPSTGEASRTRGLAGRGNVKAGVGTSAGGANTARRSIDVTKSMPTDPFRTARSDSDALGGSGSAESPTKRARSREVVCKPRKPRPSVLEIFNCGDASDKANNRYSNKPAAAGRPAWDDGAGNRRDLGRLDQPAELATVEEAQESPSPLKQLVMDKMGKFTSFFGRRTPAGPPDDGHDMVPPKAETPSPLTKLVRNFFTSSNISGVP